MRSIPKSVRQAVTTRDSIDGCPCCIYCGKPFPNGGEHLHHITRRSQLGQDIEENLVTLCYECHILGIHSRADQDIITYCKDYLERIYR